MSTIDAFATVRLELQSRPECITLVRSMLAGLGEYLELDPELLDDMKTAISEACNNVVLHAYGPDAGPLQMSLEITEHDFNVTVRDQGLGIEHMSPAKNRMGVGLAVISALSRRAEFESSPGEGTVVRMSFGAESVRRPAGAASGVAEAPPLELPGDIVVSVAPAGLLDHVMGRLVRAVAAGAHFSVDRFPSLHRLTSAISDRAAAMDSNSVSFSIVGRPKHLELRVGPLPDGPPFDTTPPEDVEAIVERIETSSLPEGELISVVLVEPGR